MRKLIITRGAPGSGKSTLLKNLGLEFYSLSSDHIRQIISGLEMTTSGSVGLSQSHNDRVYAMLQQLASERMGRGETLALDSTLVKSQDFKSLFELAYRHRYEILCLDLSATPTNISIQRDQQRVSAKRVGESVSRRMETDFKNSIRPEHPLMTVLEAKDEASLSLLMERATQWLALPIADFSDYQKIVHIGDLQGCFSVLAGPKGPLGGGFQKDTRYIFVGDVIDRGLENGVLMKWLIQEALPLENVDFIWGNHEDHLHRWSRGIPHVSAEFQYKTLPQLEQQGLTPSDADRFLTKVKEVLPYTYHGRHVMVTHAGLSSVPEHFYEISLHQYSHGTGHWEDPVGDQFHRQAPEGWDQVHGHRNHGFTPVQSSPRNFCLEGGVESGGNLCVASLSQEGWSTQLYRNTVFASYRDRRSNFGKSLEAPWIDRVSETKMGDEIWQSMVDHPGVKTTANLSFPHIVSLNFTRDVFFQKSWDDVVVKARGLFVNKATHQIIARGYEKFFNVGEREETTLPQLVDETLTFPIVLYLKENGFLGNLGYDSETEDLFVASKSSPDGDFAGYFKEIFEQTTTPEVRESLRRYLRDQEASMVFEVIDPVRDPHMIEYDRPQLVLLDVFHRSTEVEHLPYEKLQYIGKHFGIPVKDRAMVFKSAPEFTGWLKVAQQDLSWRFKGKDVEGFVIEDAKGYQTKVKLPHYSFWKKMRGVKDRICRMASKMEIAKLDRETRVNEVNQKRHAGGLLPLDVEHEKLREEEELLKMVSRDSHPLARQFTQWCLSQPAEVLKQDIIALRSKYQKEIGITEQDLKTKWLAFDPSEKNEDTPIKVKSSRGPRPH